MTPDYGITRSKVKVTVSKVKVTVTLNIKMVSADYPVNHLSLTYHISPRWLVMTSRWLLLILWAVSQRSRSQLPCMSKWFPLIFLKFINHSQQYEARVRKGGAYVSFNISCYPFILLVNRTSVAEWSGSMTSNHSHLPLWAWILPGMMDSFMWGICHTSFMNINSSTQVSAWALQTTVLYCICPK